MMDTRSLVDQMYGSHNLNGNLSIGILICNLIIEFENAFLQEAVQKFA